MKKIGLSKKILIGSALLLSSNASWSALKQQRPPSGKQDAREPSPEEVARAYSFVIFNKDKDINGLNAELVQRDVILAQRDREKLTQQAETNRLRAELQGEQAVVGRLRAELQGEQDEVDQLLAELQDAQAVVGRLRAELQGEQAETGRLRATNAMILAELTVARAELEERPQAPQKKSWFHFWV
jgi:chromosome segregation ATPase